MAQAESAFVAESFNGRLRDECLNVEVFLDVADARSKIEKWRRDYNQQRPHSALANRIPQEFACAARNLHSAFPDRSGKPNDPAQDVVFVEELK